MDQEVRNSDIFTMLASFMDTQSHGIQNSQSNNNNSNTSNNLRRSSVAGDNNLTDDSHAQMDAAATQNRNSHLLNIARQTASLPLTGAIGATSDREIAEIERISAYMHPNFSSGVSVPAPMENLYGAANQVTETANVMDTPVPFSSNAGYFPNSQSQDILFDALNSIDASVSCQRGGRSDSTTFAHSYVSLLQQQSMDSTGGGFWPMNSPAVSYSSVGSSGNKQISAGNTPSRSTHSISHNLLSSSTSTDKITPSHPIQSVNSSKVTPSTQQTSRALLASKGSRSTPQFSHNLSSSFSSRNIGNKNINDLVLPIGSESIDCEDEIEDRSQEKKLTRTPIPSDADKSSCSSSSSGSASGPEQSPDHPIEQSSSRIDARESKVPANPNTSRSSDERENHSVLNVGSSKNYPCYGNMNVLNFGTINFSPVMDNSLPISGETANNKNAFDVTVSVQNSNSVVDIDSGSRNNAMASSSVSQTSVETGSGMRPAYLKAQKGGTFGGNSYAEMQTVTTAHHLQNNKKSKPKNTDSLRNLANGGRLPVLSHSLLQSNDRAMTQDDLRAKQKKSRNAKHKHAQVLSQGKNNMSSHYNSFTFSENGQPSNLKPKVNADPTQKINTVDNSVNHNIANTNNMLAMSNPMGNVPQESYPSHNTGNTRYVVPSQGRAMYNDPGKPRHWQTVTAVQGPKLPPMLSEQDRIPKRGRPSKKMMQQNLKVKKDAPTPVNPPTLVQRPRSPEPKLSQTTQPSQNLVSMYTINDKGLMEEIAPKAKENRRSKERTEAFRKYLDDIKIASKQQKATNPKFGEKAKTGADKQTKKKSRPRTKVFGRVSQPLTKEGITETMCTFSALAHQYKISSSIVERATENLLKSAGKRSIKEQHALTTGQSLTDKQTKVQHIEFVKSDLKKGVPFVTSHCETRTTQSSKVLTVPTMRLAEESLEKDGISSTVEPVTIPKTLAQLNAVVNLPSTAKDSIKAVDNISGKEIVQDAVIQNVERSNVANNLDAVSDRDKTSINTTTETLQHSIKVKHKKKKHKKHKKHKHQEIPSGKKKKKDKERKKKLKKKLKTKSGHGVIPSTSASLVKPPTKPKLGITEIKNLGSDTPKLQDNSPYIFTPSKSTTFSSSFRQSGNTGVDHSNPWQQEDNTYDPEDSSSDEMSMSPKSYNEVTPETQTTSVTSSTLTPFAQYSNSCIGFGTFSGNNTGTSSKIQSSNASKSSAPQTDSHEQSDVFPSQSIVRPSKKHPKHKKKKLFRKSKSNFDPAFLLILDELLVKVQKLNIGPESRVQRLRPSTNIFFSANVSDIPQTTLWRSTTLPSTKSRSLSNAINKKTIFPQGLPDVPKRRASINNSFLSTSQNPESRNGADSLSVFCKSSFFQKYGYVAEINATSHHEDSSSNAQTKSNAVQTLSHSLPNAKNQSLQGENILQKISSDNVSATKRKRGWPRGKPRGPRAKRGRPSKLRFVENGAGGDATAPTLSTNETNSVADFKGEPGTESNKVSSEKKETSNNLQSSSMQHSDLSSKLVSESFMQQIRQVIEKNLPANVNKDAITKSVDKAVLEYFENMKNNSSTTDKKDKGSAKRLTRRGSSVDDSDNFQKSAKSDTSMRMNVDKHPKKVWAYKHQDTSSLPVPTNASSKTTTAVPRLKKKKPGRPRKYPIDSKLAPISIMQGKVPLSSATVVPAKHKVSAVRMQGKKCMRPAVKRLLARARSNFAYQDNTLSPQPSANCTSNKISKANAISSVRTLYSAKMVKLKTKHGHMESASEPGMYASTVVGRHISDAIDMTVEMYSWDNYKEFEEACATVEKDMGLSDDFDQWMSDNKPKTSTVKKSIESVVEKLKSKQAQSMSAATALIELSHSTCESKSEEDDSEKSSSPQSPSQDTINKMATVNRRNSLSSNIKTHKVKKSHSIANSSLLKRPRGRPRKNQIREDTEPITKKNKIVNLDKQPPRKTSAAKDDQKREAQIYTTTANETNSIVEAINPALSPKKPYLEAGLYSSTFKRNSTSSNHTPDLSGDATNLPAKLPPPFDAGLYLRSTLKDFQLPYNIWWMYKHKKISVSQDPSTNFVKINKNVYAGQRPVLNLGEHICTCKPNDNCGKGCLNRLIYFECQPSSCPCASGCANQVIQKSEWCKSLERFKTADKGWGIRTTEKISEGSFILEYVGEVLSEVEFRVRTIELYHAYNDHYCVQLDSSTVIDGYRMANEGRFVNHSCEPNCEMQKWCVAGEHRIGLFALRQIQANEELSYDYNFHAYDIDTQQPCRCGSCKCRGVIGGRNQQLISEPCLNANKSNTSVKSPKSSTGKQSKPKEKKSKDDDVATKEFSILQMKPISKHDKDIIIQRQLFLLRNLAKVRRKEEEQNKGTGTVGKRGSGNGKSGNKSKSKKGSNNKEDSEKIEAAITEMYTAIATCKDQNGVSVAIPFMNLPSKKKNPEYYERISDPIDLSMIERNIVSNHYKDIETFNSDVQRVFKNAEKYHGRKSTLGKDVIRLRKAYANARGAAMLLLNGHKKATKSTEISDDDGSDTDGDGDTDGADENIHRKNEDHIRCICGIYKDEGLMVQCEKCYVWQHCDCMGLKPGNTDSYLCEECDPRPYSKEVKVVPPPSNTPPGHTYYVTLLRDEMLVKQGDCAYLVRDHRLRRDSSTSAVSMRASNRNLANISHDKVDIFRVEQLWTDERGDKYAYGYHFLRPHETHHSPSRTFYRNELFASPFYEIIPLEAVVGLCCVMDLYSYCKGKPKDFKMTDIFICDFRIDKAASLFTRINKKRYPICTKPHVFDAYKNKICPKKDFQPHQVPEQYKKSGGRPANSDIINPDVVEICSSQYSGFAGNDDELFNESEVGSTKWRKRRRLNGIAHRLLSKLPKQAIDVSYLLEPGSGKRQRKKTQLSLESLSQQK